MQKLTVPGKPVPKARHQVRLYKGGVVTYTPPKTREFERRIRLYALKHKVRKREGKLAVAVLFRTNGPGDLDNLLKSLLDGLNNLAWEDDRQVTGILALKMPPEHEEETEVVILSMDTFVGAVREVLAQMGEG